MSFFFRDDQQSTVADILVATRVTKDSFNAIVVKTNIEDALETVVQDRKLGDADVANVDPVSVDTPAMGR